MLKKILSIALCIAITFTLFACGGQQTIQSSENLSSSDGGTKTSNTSKTVSLKAQIQNCKAVIDCSEDVLIDQMDTVVFGVDEQGNPIEWLVLEKNNSKALLLTKYIHPAKNYYYKYTDNISWEDSTIREWLNNEYINKAFNEKELGVILTTDVINSDNDKFGTRGGNNTKDKIFLLSIDEVEKYLKNESLRNPEEKYPTDGAPYWWLRSPGKDLSRAAYVHGNGGSIYEAGHPVFDGMGLRPALWVKY